MLKILCLTSIKQVLDEDRVKNNKLKVLRQEQKSIAVMRYLVDRMSNPGDLVVYRFEGS